MHKKDQIRSVLLGVAVGDALGVPVEFKSRAELQINPVTDMTGYGTHEQPPGTFSDDSSLTFCLAEALTVPFNLQTVAEHFADWCYNDYWTARGEMFDIGNTTAAAIDNLASAESPELAGGRSESSNGNGSLMRISPLVFHLAGKPLAERFELTRQVSSITHGHVRSIIACFYYLEFARHLLIGKDKFDIYEILKSEISNYLVCASIDAAEIALFDRLLKENIYEQEEAGILSRGYVVDTLEASIWCLLTTGNYKDAVLKAVNLGEDTDTTGAVTGGLAGLLYGAEGIPDTWLATLARREDIEDLADRMSKSQNEVLA